MEKSQDALVRALRSAFPFEGSLAELLRFRGCQLRTLRKSRRIASFLTLSSSKIEETSQNCCVLDVVKFQNKRTGQPHKSTSSDNQKKWLKQRGESRKDKGDGGGSIIQKVVCEELCVTKLCVKDGMRARGTEGRKDGRADGIQKQKQEAHTKMRGKSYLREMDSLAAWMSPNATLARQNEG